MVELDKKDDKKVIELKNTDKLRKLQEQPKYSYSLPFLVNEKTGIIKKNSIYNIIMILSNDKLLKDTFQFNEYTEAVDVMKDIKDLNIEKGQLKDVYISLIAAYIETQGAYSNILFDDQKIRSAISVYASSHSYNPIKDYFNEAFKKWDGKPRLQNLLPDFLGAEPGDLTLLITRQFLVGAIAKTFNPMTKFDMVLDLVGGQGVGKTTFLKNLAPLGYYTDQFASFSSKDDFAVMKNAVIVNDDELTASHNSSFEELKKFVTMQEFEYRKAYGHTAEKFHKKFVMSRTTNERYYLKDLTGSRRFMPILADKANRKKNAVTDMPPEFVQQIWGEAMALYKSGDFSFALTSEEEVELESKRTKFNYVDAFEDKLADVLESDNFRYANFITNDKLADALGLDLLKNRKAARKLQSLMLDRFKWSRKVKKIGGKTARGYARSSQTLH